MNSLVPPTLGIPRRGGRGRHRGGDTTHTEGAASRYRRPAGAPASPPGRRPKAKWPRGGGSVPAGEKKAQLTGGRRAREPRVALRALPTPYPGRPRLSPRDPEVLAAAPAGGPHLPLQTEAAPAPPSHIGQGRAARSPPRRPDRATAGPRAPPPAAAPALPFICGSRCHKMALREDARPRRPTPFPLLPPPRPAPPRAAHRPALKRRSRSPPSSPPGPVSGRLTHRVASRTRPQPPARHQAPPRGGKTKGRHPPRRYGGCCASVARPTASGTRQIQQGPGEKRAAGRGGRRGRRSAAGHHGKGGGGRDWRRGANALAGHLRLQRRLWRRNLGQAARDWLLYGVASIGDASARWRARCYLGN